jgi:PAS domain S-box-containing protein
MSSPSGDTPHPVHSILYVDDEPALLEVCKRYFERRGEFSVTCAGSAREAIGLLTTHSFGVIISDYQMPGMTGIDFLVHLRLQQDRTPFILFTGKGREEIVIEAINNGASYYLQKRGSPAILFPELEHKIREAIRNQASGAAVKERVAGYQAAFEHSGAAMVVHEEDLTIHACNTEFLQLTGWPRADVEGRKVLTEFFSCDEHRNWYARNLPFGHHQNGHDGAFEAGIRTRAGDVLSARIVANRIPGTTRCVVSVVDITKRKQLEEELRKKEEEIGILMAYIASEKRRLSGSALMDKDCFPSSGLPTPVPGSLNNMAPAGRGDTRSAPPYLQTIHSGT